MKESLVALSFAVVFGTPACRAEKSKEDDPPERSGPSVTGASAPAGHVRMAPAPAAGDVPSTVRDELAKTAREKRRLIVYVGARWCEPCRRFHEAAERGELDAALGDLTLLEFDLDRDADRLHEGGYMAEYIPLFALPAADGTASGKQIEGAIKGEGAVAFIVPRLIRLLAQ